MNIAKIISNEIFSNNPDDCIELINGEYSFKNKFIKDIELSVNTIIKHALKNYSTFFDIPINSVFMSDVAISKLTIEEWSAFDFYKIAESRYGKIGTIESYYVTNFVNK